MTPPTTSSRSTLPPTWSPSSPSLSSESYPSTTAPEATQYSAAAAYDTSYDVPNQPMSPEAQGFTPRVARLTVASIDPFSVLKLSFLLSVAAGVALVVATVVLWMVLKGIGVFDQLNNLFQSIGGLDTSSDKFDIYDYIGLKRVISISAVIGIVDVILLTALSTVTAFLYNLAAGLVGGVRVTLSDD